jgi:hypothetical protein
LSSDSSPTEEEYSKLSSSKKEDKQVDDSAGKAEQAAKLEAEKAAAEKVAAEKAAAEKAAAAAKAAADKEAAEILAKKKAEEGAKQKERAEAGKFVVFQIYDSVVFIFVCWQHLFQRCLIMSMQLLYDSHLICVIHLKYSPFSGDVRRRKTR